MKKILKLLILVNLTIFVTHNAFAFDPYDSSTGDGVTVEINNNVVSLNVTNTTSKRTAYQFMQLPTNYNFNLGYHLNTPLSGGYPQHTQQIQFGFSTNTKGWDGVIPPSERFGPAENFEPFNFVYVSAGTTITENGTQRHYWNTSNSWASEYTFPYWPPDAECPMLSCASQGIQYIVSNRISTTGTTRSDVDGVFYGEYNESKDELRILASEKKSNGELTDPKLIALLNPRSENLNNFFVGGVDISGANVTAAPEPITTTLFLVGGGLMGLDRLRRKKV